MTRVTNVLVGGSLPFATSGAMGGTRRLRRVDERSSVRVRQTTWPRRHVPPDANGLIQINQSAMCRRCQARLQRFDAPLRGVVELLPGGDRGVVASLVLSTQWPATERAGGRDLRTGVKRDLSAAGCTAECHSVCPGVIERGRRTDAASGGRDIFIGRCRITRLKRRTTERNPTIEFVWR